MWKSRLIFLLIQLALFALVLGSSDPLTVMTYNIRLNTPDDGENAWPHRKDAVAELIGNRYRVDLAGLQEALPEQIADLALRLPDYSWVGVGRDDGKTAGEFCPIFYRHQRLELLERDTFWLSETPQVPGSRSWDAALTRIVTWARFRERKKGTEFFHFNTHFDHRGKKARRHSAELLKNQVLQIAGDTPHVITGDLNARSSSAPIQILQSHFRDSREASAAPPVGAGSTFNNWNELIEGRIDFVFVSPSVEVLSYQEAADRFRGRFPSDHLPVVVRLQLP